MKSYTYFLLLACCVELCSGRSLRSIVSRTLDEIKQGLITIDGGSSDNILPEEYIDYMCEEQKLRFLTIGRSTANEKGLDFSKQAYPFLLCGGKLLFFITQLTNSMCTVILQVM